MNVKPSILVLVVSLVACSAACAESVKDTLNSKYNGQVLALRTPFSQGKMTFDSAGRPVHARPGSPWLVYGGLRVEKLGLSKATIHLEGHRVGYTGAKTLVTLGKGVSIEIQLDKPVESADEAYAALSRVFYLDNSNANLEKPELRRADDTIAGEPIYHLGQDGTLPAKATYMPQPDFSDAARKAKFQGIVGLTIVVDKAGNVARVRLERALGYGLDENAMERVSVWRFTPATHNGQPVAIEMWAEVQFHLY
jgi:TonB family protein